MLLVAAVVIAAAAAASPFDDLSSSSSSSSSPDYLMSQPIHPDKKTAIHDIKQILHLLSPEQANERMRQLHAVHGRTAPPPRRQQKIDHFVVVYMENRAFDHIFGCHDKPGIDGVPKDGHQVPVDPHNASKGFVNVTCGTAKLVYWQCRSPAAGQQNR